MSDEPQPPAWMPPDFLLGMLRNMFDFDGRALAVRDDPEALRALLEECFGPELRLRRLDAGPLVEKLHQAVVQYRAGGDVNLYQACRQVMHEAAARQAKRDVSTMLHEQLGLPEDFEEQLCTSHEGGRFYNRRTAMRQPRDTMTIHGVWSSKILTAVVLMVGERRSLSVVSNRLVTPISQASLR